MTDFIIVGRGLAAASLMHAFYEEGITFLTVGDRRLSRCSQVAAGIYNPIVFKRMNASWMADKLLPELKRFYRSAEKRTGSKFLHERNIIRYFNEEQERQLWIKKSRNELDDFLSSEIVEGSPGGGVYGSEFGYGSVKESGNLDLPVFINATEKLFAALIRDEIFDHADLDIFSRQVSYRGLQANAIVFCEGHLVSKNPFFNWIPFKPAKGEILEIEMEDAGIGNSILNKSAYFMKVAAGRYILGSTYEWDKLNEDATEEAKEELEKKLSQTVRSPFAIIGQKAGIRPSIIDRRPVLGPHPKYNNLYVFNGFGTKGVMIAPYFSKKFVNFYLQKETPGPDISVKRFYRLYEEQT
jgi:glycine oxidase